MLTADKLTRYKGMWIICDDIGTKPMRKFAPVCPARIYKGMADNKDRGGVYFPDTILLLAHDVAANAKEYEEVFKDPLWNDVTIIMDNSVVELGESQMLETVKIAADIVCADVVVLPDVLGRGDESRKATLDAWEKWYWQFRDYELMAVIQGQDFYDWLHSAEVFAKEIEPDWIAIPRVAEPLQQVYSKTTYVRLHHRHELVPFISALFPQKPIHLLGFSQDPIWDLKAAAHPAVKSIDSAVPLRFTGRLLTEDAGKRGDWWETTQFDVSMVERCTNVDLLINAM